MSLRSKPLPFLMTRVVVELGGAVSFDGEGWALHRRRRRRRRVLVVRRRCSSSPARLPASKTRRSWKRTRLQPRPRKTLWRRCSASRGACRPQNLSVQIATDLPGKSARKHWIAKIVSAPHPAGAAGARRVATLKIVTQVVGLGHLVLLRSWIRSSMGKPCAECAAARHKAAARVLKTIVKPASFTGSGSTTKMASRGVRLRPELTASEGGQPCAVARTAQPCLART